MSTQQLKANEIRDLITQINARVVELEEDGYTIEFDSSKYAYYVGKIPQNIKGKIKEIKITRVIEL